MLGRMLWFILRLWEYLCFKNAGRRGNKITGPKFAHTALRALYLFSREEREISCTMAFIGHSPHNNEKGIGTEMSPAIVSGFLFGEEPVSYWPVFSPIPCNRPRRLCESKFGAVPSCFLSGEFAEFFCAKTSWGAKHPRTTLAFLKWVIWKNLFRLQSNLLR